MNKVIFGSKTINCQLSTVNRHMKFLQNFCGEKLVLDILACGGKLYPLEILNQLNQNRKIPFSLGYVYFILNKLEKKGLVEWEWGELENISNCRRKYYKLISNS